MRIVLYLICLMVSLKIEANPAEFEIIEKQNISLLSSSTAPRSEPLQWFIPAKSYWLKKYHEEQVLYRHKVHLNELGLRITASDVKKARYKKHLFFVGCSITLGQGVEDQQTFSYLVSQALEDYQVRNAGFRGAGIQDLHYFWKYLDLKQLSSQEEGILVVTLIPDHFSRLRLGWRYLDWAFPFATHYEVSENELHFKGLVSETWSYKWSQVIKKLGLSYWWLRLSHFHSGHLMRQGLAKMPILLRELKHEYLKQFPKGRFIVTWMRDDFIPMEKERSQFYGSLKQENIEFWPAEKNKDVDELLKTKRWHIPHDGHPTPLAHRKYSDQLIRQINCQKQNSIHTHCTNRNMSQKLDLQHRSTKSL